MTTETHGPWQRLFAWWPRRCEIVQDRYDENGQWRDRRHVGTRWIWLRHYYLRQRGGDYFWPPAQWDYAFDLWEVYTRP